MQPNPDTIRFLRQLTADGSLTDDEVWSLGNYLNDNHAARESWPGNLLFDILRVIFADSALDPRELQALAYYLRAIELQCAVADDEPAGATPEPAAEAFFETSDCRIPTIHAELDVAEKGALRKQAHVDLDKQQCNCSEWTFKRKFLPEGSPGRACKHMVQALHSPAVSVQIPALEAQPKLAQILRHHSELGRGLDADANWKLVRADGAEFVVAWGETGFVHVFTDNEMGGLERYSYNLESERWAFGQRPPNADLIQRYIVQSRDYSA